MSFEPRTLKYDFDAMSFDLKKHDLHYFAVNGPYKWDVTRFVSKALKSFANFSTEEFDQTGIGIDFKVEMDCTAHIDDDRGTLETDGHTNDMSTVEDIEDADLQTMFFRVGNMDGFIVESEEIDVSLFSTSEKKDIENYIESKFQRG